MESRRVFFAIGCQAVQDAEPADAEDAMPSAAEASETLEALEATVTTVEGPAEALVLAADRAKRIRL